MGGGQRGGVPESVGRGAVRRTVIAALAVGMCACGDGTGGGGGPLPGNYTTVAGDNWHSYASDAALQASGFYAAGSHPTFTIANNVTRVNDPLFGQVARITQPADTFTTGAGWTPSYSHAMPSPLNRFWFRFFVRFSPLFTTASPYPNGAANSYKLAFIGWQNYNGRSEVEYTNTTQYFPGFDFGVSATCTNVLMPNSPSNWGSVTTEWSNGEWWEMIMYYQKTSTDDAQHRWWRREYTSSGTIVNNAYTYIGTTRQNCDNPTPAAESIVLGANKNKVTQTTQYIYWGPWEVVDGSVYPNPWGVGP